MALSQLGYYPDAIERALTRHGPQPKLPPARTLLTPYLAFIDETLQTFPRLIGARLEEMIREGNFVLTIVRCDSPEWKEARPAAKRVMRIKSRLTRHEPRQFVHKWIRSYQTMFIAFLRSPGLRQSRLKH